MKPLIAILSCVKDRPYAQAQRETCLKDSVCDYRFFYGGVPVPPLYATAWDEVWFEKIGDDYASLPFKTQSICRWALANAYDYIFKCDTDTYVHVPRLLASGYEQWDYSGYYRGNHEVPGGYASGGSGYWLSRRAMEVVANTEMQLDWIDGDRGYVCGEDLQVGRAMLRAGIICYWDERYRLDAHLPDPTNDLITNHNVREPNKGDQMRNVHRWVTERFAKRHI